MLKRFFTIALIGLSLGLQYKLWLAPGGWRMIHQLREQIAMTEERNQDIERLNAQLIADIDNLKHGTELVEDQARRELGLIRDGEIYYRYV